jgi:hypothetical protein
MANGARIDLRASETTYIHKISSTQHTRHRTNQEPRKKRREEKRREEKRREAAVVLGHWL